MKSHFSTVPSCNSDSATTDVESSLKTESKFTTPQSCNPDTAINVEDVSTVQDYNPDPATWLFPVPDAMMEHLLEMFHLNMSNIKVSSNRIPWAGPSNSEEVPLQNTETNKKFSGFNRCLTKKSFFFRIKQNKEILNITWLVMSLTNKSLYCWSITCFLTTKLKCSLRNILCMYGLSD